MVDVLINCLLRNREVLEELNASGVAPERLIEMPDGAFYDHPVNAATSAMLNVGGGSSPATEDSSTSGVPPSNSVSLLCEYYKLPLDKVEKSVVDKYSLPDFWTTVTNGQTSLVGNIGNVSNALSGSLPLSLVPQATEISRNRRLSDATEVNPQEVEIYLNRGLIKRESPDSDELVVPTSSVISSHKSSEILKNCTTNKAINDSVASDSPESPLPILIQVKQEQASPGLSTSPSPPTTESRELPSASTVIAQAYPSHVLPQGYESIAQYPSTTLPQYQSQPTTSVYMVTTPPDYRGLPDYYTEQIRHNLAATVASTVPAYTDAADTASFVDRYIRQVGYKGGIHGLTVDLPSPDSGIGETTITPNRETSSGLTQVGEIFEYSELPAQTIIQSEPTQSRPASSHSGSSRRSWQEYGRNSESDKVQIPKLHSDVGFKYFLESPISTSQRREDDRITYINKGQFYGITLEYIPDPSKPLKSTTVKSVVMLMFREDKPHDEELKAWQFWHSRQHSVKQRILDADTKNNTGIVGQIEELSHNAVAFYWNPLEAPAKVNIAVQCLSTDFSNQKGVKGLPLHLQIDTFDDFRESSPPQHRGYCQIKVFCDKGAERKTRDEERRAAKRKLNSSNAAADGAVTFPGRKKIDEMYHLPCDRSEFYSMSDLLKPPILFTPSDDIDKITSMDLSYYTTHGSTLEDHNPAGIDRRDTDSRGSSNFTPPPPKRIKLYPADRVLLYARQQSEDTFQPLHIHPPTLAGLAKGIEKKYSINATNVRYFYKRNKKGMTVQVDDDIVKHYCNEDACLIEVTKVDDEMSDITLVEL